LSFSTCKRGTEGLFFGRYITLEDTLNDPP
jgi:hypothetical protein